ATRASATTALPPNTARSTGALNSQRLLVDDAISASSPAGGGEQKREQGRRQRDPAAELHADAKLEDGVGTSVVCRPVDIDVHDERELPTSFIRQLERAARAAAVDVRDEKARRYIEVRLLRQPASV